MLRWIQIETDNIGGLAFKVRIVAGNVALQPMRLQAGFMPDALDGIFADLQVFGQFAARPMSGSVTGLASRGFQYLRLQSRSDHRGFLSRMPDLQQASHALFFEAASPACNRRRGCIQPLLNGSIW